jgi:hypothetical protein
MSNVKEKIVRSGFRAALIVKKYSPEILLGLGIAGGIGAAVLACKATLGAHTVIDEFHREKLTIEQAKKISEANPGEDGELIYPEAAEMQDKVRVYTKAGLGMLKLYGPALGLSAVSISCVLASHGIMKRRQVALFAAFSMVQEGFLNYRRRVIESAGPDKDNEYRYGLKKDETVIEQDEKGKDVKAVRTTVEATPASLARTDYARYFDESNQNYRPDLEMNVFFVKAVQRYLNDQLRIVGHVYLNDAYRQLGFPDSKAGAIVGWLYDPDGDTGGDNYIDLKLQSLENMSGRSIPAILVDFNVDGIIFDLI